MADDIELLRLRARAKLKLEQDQGPETKPTPEKPGFISGAVDTLVDTLPVTGAAVGGALGATAGGAATLGLGAAPAGFAGAVGGGAVGQVLKDNINKYRHPEEAPQDVASVYQNIAESVPASTMQEAGGRIIQAAAAPVLKAVTPKITGILSWVGDKAEATSTSVLRRWMGFTKSAIKNVRGVDNANEIVGTLKTQNLFADGASPEAVLGRVKAIQGESGQVIGDFWDGPYGNQRISDVPDLQHRIGDKVANIVGKNAALHPEAVADIQAIEKTMAQYAEPDGSIKGYSLWKLKSALGDLAFPPPAGPGVVKKSTVVFEKAWQAVSDAMHDGLGTLKAASEEMPGPPSSLDFASPATRASGKLIDRFSAAQTGQEAALGLSTSPNSTADLAALAAANKVHSAATVAAYRMADKAAGQASGSPWNLVRKTAAMTIGGRVGGIPGMVAGAAAEDIAAKHGAQAVSRGLDAGSRLIQRIVQTSPKALGKFAGVLTSAAARNALPQTHFTLMQSTDPTYRNLFKKLVEKESNGK